MKTKANKQYEARMYRIGYSQHSTEQAAKRALAKFRREYRDTQAPMPYPWQIVEKDGVVIYTA